MCNLNLVTCNQVEDSSFLTNSFPIQENPYLEHLNRRSHYDSEENIQLLHHHRHLLHCDVCFVIPNNVYHNIMYSYIF
jgi:hypothetical protein